MLQRPHVHSLVRKLRAYSDPSIRTGYLRSVLSDMDTAEVAEALVLALHGAEAGDPEHADLLQDLSLAFADPRCDRLRDEVRRHLMDRDLQEPAAMLTQNDEESPEGALSVPDFGVGRPLALGERKSLARRAGKDTIQRILRDPDRDVIRILLDNPGLTEDDVVRLAARRPVAPDVLREVFKSPRWVVRYSVKVALAMNPHSPLDVRLQLAPHLSGTDVQRLLETPRLHPLLRASCQRMRPQQPLH